MVENISEYNVLMFQICATARMAQVNLERRAAVRSSREAIREVVQLKELQHNFVCYRSKVRSNKKFSIINFD